MVFLVFFFQAEDGIRDLVRSRGLGDVYKRQVSTQSTGMLHYTTYLLKPEAPWVTFVHGAGGSSAIWFKQVRDFKKSFNVLLVDLRGHGTVSYTHLTLPTIYSV
eukprot:TRINITY_DN1777_c0_g1_i1.p1 TRINITY_DN1777_c0_g1~~TRINITY_DN1777_c0_g1_i1.p1  ORF type:complete len:104 (-),score=36.32 TRINITY_DN1777_c0_g1_i1:157-468(-)